MQRNTQIPVGKHNNRQHASPHHEVDTDVKQMPIRPIILYYHGPLTRYVQLRMRMRRECRERPYLFVLISPQVITLMSTLLCFCFCCVLINAIFASDFATVTFVLLASKTYPADYQKHFSYCVNGMVINAVQTIATMDKCEIRSRKLQSHSQQIQCCVCFNHYHMKYITPSPEDLLKLTNESN